MLVTPENVVLIHERLKQTSWGIVMEMSPQQRPDHRFGFLAEQLAKPESRDWPVPSCVPVWLACSPDPRDSDEFANILAFLYDCQKAWAEGYRMSRSTVPHNQPSYQGESSDNGH